MDKPPVRCYIALGSNLDNPLHQVQTAIAALKTLPRSTLVRTSQLYLSTPLGPSNQPCFINAVAAIDTELSSQVLLQQLLQIEAKQGRTRSIQDIRWGPRIIDLDILLYGDEIINIPELIVPHPELMQRNFVLYPLAEIDPELRLPNNILLKNLLAQCPPVGLEAVTTL